MYFHFLSLERHIGFHITLNEATLPNGIVFAWCCPKCLYLQMMNFPKLLVVAFLLFTIQLPAIPWASSPGWIYCLYLWPMLNPFTSQSAINMTYGVAVYSRCGHCVRVLKGIFPPQVGFTPLNHSVHNKNIKMSKWPNDFCGINNTLAVVPNCSRKVSTRW